MPSLLKILAVKSKDVKTGTVMSRGTNGYYQIRSSGRIMQIKSAMLETIPVGAGVVITDTGDGRFIVGREKIKNRAQKEVTING